MNQGKGNEENEVRSDSLEKEKTKRRNYKKELQQAIAEISDLKEQLLRKAAEFDNFRKRTNNEKIEIIEKANAELLLALLPLLDDLERFSKSDNVKNDLNALPKGVEMVHKNFIKILEEQGLCEMETVGKQFDPDKHDALMQQEAKNTPPDIILDEHLKGYEFRDRVLRHAKVIVSK